LGVAYVANLLPPYSLRASITSSITSKGLDRAICGATEKKTKTKQNSSKKSKIKINQNK